MTTDIIFDEIESIEEIDYKHQFVYDLSVSQNETFALTNGLMVHNTLNTFHLAGVSSKSNVNQGVPRFRELISITRNPATPSLTLYIKKSHDTSEKILDALSDIEKVSFDYFVKTTEIYFDPMIYNYDTVIEKDKTFIRDYYSFYKLFFDLSDNINTISPWVLRIEMFPLYILNKKISMLELTEILKRELAVKYGAKQKINIIHSNENSENIVFHIRFVYSDIYKKVEDNYITNDDMTYLRDIENFLMSDLIVKGNKNIKEAYLREIKEKYVKKSDGSIQTKNVSVIDTIGNDLRTIIIDNDFVDPLKSFSNDLHEMYDLYGIEVAREVLKNEIINIVKHNGIYINKRHINLLIDLMTFKGVLNSIDRHGMNKADVGVLAKTSFEEAESQLTHASVFGQEDKMQSITSTLIMGQQGVFGTGYADVIFTDESFD